MAQDLTTTSTPSRPALPSNASNDYIAASLTGRCDQADLSDALRTLLGLFFVPSETDAERARQIALFLTDLSDMSDDCVWWAMREWRRNNDRRPSPASLRQLCMMRRAELTRERDRRSVKADDDPTLYKIASPETQAERAESLARIAAETGMVRVGRVWSLPDRPEDAPKVGPHWSLTERAANPMFTETLRRARADNPLAGPA